MNRSGMRLIAVCPIVLLQIISLSRWIQTKDIELQDFIRKQTAALFEQIVEWCRYVLHFPQRLKENSGILFLGGMPSATDPSLMHQLVMLRTCDQRIRNEINEAGVKSAKQE